MNQSTRSQSGSIGQLVNASHLGTPNLCDGARRGVSWIRNTAPPSAVADACFSS